MNVLNVAELSSGLTQLHRPIRLRLAHQGAIVKDLLHIKHAYGQETMCGGIEYRLLCVSTQAALPLKELIALSAELQFVTDRGHLRTVCGIVSQAFAGQSDGGLASYQLVVSDALSLMEQRVNTRIFRNMNEVDISAALVGEWRATNPILAAAFEVDTLGIRDIYPPREFIMQHNESDAAFLRRLWKRQGIAWFIRPGRHRVSEDTASPVHTLVLFDAPLSLAQNAAGTVRFHRDAGTEARDAVFNWCAARHLKAGSLTRQSWDYRQGRMMLAQSTAIIEQGKAGNQFALNLDDHQIDAPHVGDDSNDYRRLGDLRMQRLEYETKCFYGESGVRDLRVGEWFRLDGHPDIDTHRGQEREFVVTELFLAAEGNLPKDFDERAERLFTANAWRQGVSKVALDHASGKRDVRYTNRFACVRRGIPIVPAYDPRTDLPSVHLQSALVVGPPGEEVHCDELGRIKLRFPGMREQDHPGGAGASNTDRDSAWVRVASHWAGDGWGSSSLPRVGAEVLVDFLGGDPDKPIVVGRVHGGLAAPPAFSHAGRLPGNRFVAGIKSKEVQGMRYNQLRLDDTPGQISAQLASEHGHSQLNLGWLTHPRRNGEGQARGEGAELRSDQSVVLRAAKLMLLTTQAMLGATGKQLERKPLQALLEASQGLLKEMGEFAEQHQAMPVDLAPHRQLADDLADAEQAGAPLIAQYSEGGLVNASPKSVVSYSGRQQNIVAQQHIQAVAGQRVNIQAGQGMSLFSHQDGMKHIARAGKLEMQAQQDSIGIAAAQDVRISASQGDIVIAAKKSITLSCGGAYLKIAEGNIELGCSGAFTVKAGVHKWDGPAEQETQLPFFPAADHTNWLKLDLDGYQGAPMAGVPYTLYFANGQQKQGTLDGNGMAEERNLPDTVDKLVYHNSPSAKDEPRPVVADLMAKLEPLMAQEPNMVNAPQNRGGK
ncbi:MULTISPECIES: type VI secretion system Vgr family protein [unclassified Massilia]|uniref:type VI secretion system Vgr family protein n=1 Tax=unclassified Massilia TaxID=2609279 RepID=UPI001B810C79|nr:MULTISPECIES: type VI secretion system Vgr family protein [unclassified Massilia]MBQ5939452.1 type VI secretion system tip protein VgrG [Massilia sp. AB1]MBQ5962085.1 type VI secretion system tip protein VgrG [Massilia sp. ZL223]